jgi:tetratricopeptide (TPR) repeat protein
MAIEGPLRELGIHDVFQLLDLSRKTGALTVTSVLRDNQGTVYFDRGGVVFAAIRSNPHPLGELLLRAGKITEADLARARDSQRLLQSRRKLGELLVESGSLTSKELERQVRFQVEEVVFELMSWREGFFSFEEQQVNDAAAEAQIHISTESLLMEAARRIDEWSRIEGKVAHLGVVPVLAPVADDHPGFLDLRPREWEVLAEIDGSRDLRAIATLLAQSEFDVARIAYGLLSTGIVELRNGVHPPEHPPEPPSTDAMPSAPGTVAPLEAAASALQSGEPLVALAICERIAAETPELAAGHLLLARVLKRLGRRPEAARAVARGLEADPLNAELHAESGYCAIAVGDYLEALASWERSLRLNPGSPDAQRIRAARDATSHLRSLLQEHIDV